VASDTGPWARNSLRPDGIPFSEHLDGDGARMFQHACKLGLEGIVCKRRNAPYRSGRSKAWVKVKNPESPAMRRRRTRRGDGKPLRPGVPLAP
jgi:ATP-dependent DNA ligase